MMRKTFPMLEQFLGAYFHQDWPLEGTDSETIIKQYIHDESPGVVNKAIQELDKLLSLDLSDSELCDVVFNEIGCYYEPKHKGQSMEDWLRTVRSMLAVRAGVRV